jgi:rRNA pseudouridine-1189 N-methylase Emg1 (Nep1/Mra1 family)
MTYDMTPLSYRNQSAWVAGMYDYNALSDYVPINTPHALLREKSSVFDVVVTTADSILETPGRCHVYTHTIIDTIIHHIHHILHMHTNDAYYYDTYDI